MTPILLYVLNYNVWYILYIPIAHVEKIAYCDLFQLTVVMLYKCFGENFSKILK